jgi:hypothetical protein
MTHGHDERIRWARDFYGAVEPHAAANVFQLNQNIRP